ncbi:MAG TPA: dethiobiotin synthase [Nitrospirales bacterium]|nr:dethiobiotin synthase [Nitrospirales bacterium]
MTRPPHTPRGVFITGTDTGVGKTIVTATVVTGLKAQGIDAGAMKPIVTGVPASGSGGADPQWLLSISGVRDTLDAVSPYRFHIPAAPLVAAAHAGAPIDLNRIVNALSVLAARHECVIVEGIGGVLVPVTPDLFVVDLIKQLEVPTLVVARSGLGSINHTLLTLECLRSRGVRILGLVFNNPMPPTEDTQVHETIPTILRVSGVRSFGHLPYCEGLPATWNQHRETLITRLDVQGLLEALGLRRLA